MRRDEAGRRMEVQLLYPVRCSEPPGPRVMGVCSRGQGLSVDRGKHRLGIELRNQGWGQTSCLPHWLMKWELSTVRLCEILMQATISWILPSMVNGRLT